jgi:rod shape-determining protein MreB and related proteins
LILNLLSARLLRFNRLLENQLSLFVKNLAIDLGTANLLVYAQGEGIVYDEPCVVAVGLDHSGRRKVLAIGHEAKNMLGRTPDKIKAIRPLKNGVIADFEIAQAMLRQVINKVIGASTFFKPRIVICVPYGVTEVEKRAVKEAAESAGAREVLLVEEPIAAAIGAGLPITAPFGSMVVDIGGGSTEIAIISMKGIVLSQSVRIGGELFDDAIQNFMRRHYNILIGERTAEEIKIELANVLLEKTEKEMTIKGRDVLQGVPKTVVISSSYVREALIEPVNQIIEAIRITLEKTPPELASDIYDRGITLTGGGALLLNLDKYISQKINLPVAVAEEPLHAVVNGAGAILDRLDLVRELMLD